MSRKFLLRFRDEAEKFVQEMPDLGLSSFNPEEETVNKLINLMGRVARAENAACTITAKKYHALEFEEADVRQAGIVRALRARWPEKGKKK